jgi:flagellar M-ring protein FliF
MKVVESVASQYRSLSRPARTGLMLGVGAIVVATAIALWWLFSPSEKLLFGNLEESDAAEIAAALDEWKVPHRFSEDGTDILVDGDQVHDVRMRLVSAGIPKGGHVGYELFDKNEFGVTEFAQRINYQRALQGELERTIGAIPGVRNVRVHLSIRRGGLFLSEGGESKASVAVTTTPGETLGRKQVVGIRNLVASAVEGLTPESVVVVGPSGLQLSGGPALDGAGFSESGGEMATELEAKIGQLLREALNGGQAAVSVNVRLNLDKVHRTSERVTAQPGQDHGVVVKRSSNGAGAGDGAGAPVVLNEQVEYAHGTEREEVIQTAGKIERISIAVMLPAGTPSTELERLERLVAAAAGLDTSRGDAVEMAIAAGPDTERQLPPELDAAGKPSARAGTGAAMGAAAPYVGAVLAWSVGLVMGAILAGRRQRKRPLLGARQSEAEILRIRAWLADSAS